MAGSRSHQAPFVGDLDSSTVWEPLLLPGNATGCVQARIAATERHVAVVAHVDADGTAKAISIDCAHVDARVDDRLASGLAAERDDFELAGLVGLDVGLGGQNPTVGKAGDVPYTADTAFALANALPG